MILPDTLPRSVPRGNTSGHVTRSMPTRHPSLASRPPGDQPRHLTQHPRADCRRAVRSVFLQMLPIEGCDRVCQVPEDARGLDPVLQPVGLQGRAGREGCGWLWQGGARRLGWGNTTTTSVRRVDVRFSRSGFVDHLAPVPLGTP